MAGVSYGDERRDGTSASVAGYEPPVDVPPALVPPPGHTLASTFLARGVQVYRCSAGAWVFVEPAATLHGRARDERGGAHTVIHFRGPSWQSVQDGSLVEAAVAASVPSPGTIPQLLLRATTARGDGLLGHVTFVQRLATSGGVAPAGSCAEAAVTGVAYRAVYRFFVAAG
jgi:hypothetical protein